MTRLYISADLEGVCGVESPRQLSQNLNEAAYNDAVELLYGELDTVISSALDNGAEHILVNDSHYTMTNLSTALVSKKVRILRGKPKTCAMSAGLDNTFDAAIYLGYHAKAGTERGVLCHTFHSKLFDVSVNGISYGEGGINALYASLVHQVPVVLTSGDDVYAEEIKAVVPNIETVVTKRGISFSAAEHYTWKEVKKDFEDKVKQVFSNKDSWSSNLLSLKGPFELKITFINSQACDVALTMPGWERLDGYTIQRRCDDFEITYQWLQSAYSILAYQDHLEQ